MTITTNAFWFLNGGTIGFVAGVYIITDHFSEKLVNHISQDQAVDLLKELKKDE